MTRKFFFLLLTAAVLSACNAPQYQTTRQSDINRLTKSASFDMPKVALPEFPSRTYNVLDFGADNTGVALATEAIQKAIDECTAAGGGTVIILQSVGIEEEGGSGINECVLSFVIPFRLQPNGDIL